MDPDSIPLIITLAALLLISAFFSASETAFSSINKIRIKSLAANGNKKAIRTLELSEKYDNLLSTVLIGNNVVNILSSSIATVLFVGWYGNYGVTLATIVMTISVLIVGEITPKTLAKEAPEQFAMNVTPVLRVIVVIMTPLNKLFAAWKKLVLRVFKLKGASTITEQELLTYVEEVREDGTISEQEEDLIRSIIEFDDVQAIEICTPRVDVFAIDLQASKQQIAAIFHETGYSRLPVFRGNIDSIVGVILEKDFHYYVEAMNKSINDVVRPAIYITKTMKISELLTELQLKKTHMAVIVDEYGGTLGIITIEDILEELVGEIWDEHDEIREEVRELSENRFRVFGTTEKETLFELVDISDDESTSVTVGGWVPEKLGHIPKEGEEFEYQGVRVRVDEIVRNRVVSVIIGGREQPIDDKEADEKN